MVKLGIRAPQIKGVSRSTKLVKSIVEGANVLIESYLSVRPTFLVTYWPQSVTETSMIKFGAKTKSCEAIMHIVLAKATFLLKCRIGTRNSSPSV